MCRTQSEHQIDPSVEVRLQSVEEPLLDEAAQLPSNEGAAGKDQYGEPDGQYVHSTLLSFGVSVSNRPSMMSRVRSSSSGQRWAYVDIVCWIEAWPSRA